MHIIPINRFDLAALCCALLDVGSGELLFSQNGRDKALIASLSKIMLAHSSGATLGF